MSRDRVAPDRFNAVCNKGKSRAGSARHLPKPPRRATFVIPQAGGHVNRACERIWR